VEKLIRIGMDTSKHVFQLHGVNAAEEVRLRRKLRRQEMVAFFQRLEPTVVGIEACGGAHHWARLLGEFGHQVKLLPPKYAKAYLKRGKNDAADAEALCEAMSRPTMRFVAAKTAAQQAAQMLTGTRDRLIRRRTQLTNAIRGYAAEFGLIAARGVDKIGPLLARLHSEPRLPALARELFAWHAKEYAQLQAQLAAIDARLMAWHRQNEPSRRLVKIPGIGPIGAALLVIKAIQPEAFRSGRQFSAWIGLTPKDHSTAGKTRLGGDHSRRRRGLAQRAGRRRYRGDPASAARQGLLRAGNGGPSFDLACRTAQAQAAQARCRGAGQQNGPHRLETDGQRRTLQPRPCQRDRD
jgi:transposase